MQLRLPGGAAASADAAGARPDQMRLSVVDVSVVHQPGTPFAATALNGVTLAVAPGERIAIAGPVGSGKSTLLEVMAGLQLPTSGLVSHGERTLSRRRRPLPGTVALSFQAPEHCLFANSVFEDVGFGPRRLGLDTTQVEQRVKGALAAIGLDAEFAGRHPLALSGGEQRRVALAGALALEPEVLLLDEPTAYLDPVARLDLLRRLVALNEERGLTIVMVGHEMDELAAFCQRLVILDGGRVVADGPAGRLLADTRLLESHGLEAPGTVRLGRLLDSEPILSESQAVTALVEALEARKSHAQ